MKILQPLLLAGALSAAFYAAAQTPRPDRAVDTDGTGTADQNPEQRAAVGAARNEPVGTDNSRANASDVGDTSRFEKNKTQLHDDIAGLKNEIEGLRSSTTDQGREKLDALSSRVDGLQNRVVTSEDSERDFEENKHKFTNEVKKIRRELRDVKRFRTMKGQPVSPMEGYP